MKTLNLEEAHYQSHYTTGARNGKAGDYWEVWDGCNGYSYTRTCGFVVKSKTGNADRIADLSFHVAFGNRGNVNGMSFKDMKSLTTKCENGKYRWGKLAQVIDIVGNQIIFDC